MGHRLDLGCGSGKREGFIGIDSDPKVEPDVVADLTKGIPFPNNSVDEVWCSHFYEHLTPDEGARLIVDILRVCRRGALVTIKVPLRFSDPSHQRILDGWWFNDFDMSKYMAIPRWFEVIEYKVETIHTTSTLSHERGKPFSYEQATLVLKVVP